MGSRTSPASRSPGRACRPADSKVLNDLTIGKYDVVVTTGPSYSTQREEAVDGNDSVRTGGSPRRGCNCRLDCQFDGLSRDAQKMAARLKKTIDRESAREGRD